MKANTQKLQFRLFSFFLLLLFAVKTFGVDGKDTFSINLLGHASLYIEYKNLVIHIDPYSSQANYSNLPDADLIYITHGHSDHYDTGAINKIQKDSTLMICNQAVKNLGTYAGPTVVMKNGDSTKVKGIPTKAVASYNLTAANHPKGIGNGYLLTIGDKRVYIAGDTENIPEMKTLGEIDIAFLPMNLPYTMSVPMAAEAAKAINPDILYIYHFGNSDTAQLRKLLVNEKMEIRIGKSTFIESASKEGQVYNHELRKPAQVFTIYPNPSSGLMTLHNTLRGSNLYIFDHLGRLIEKRDEMSIGDSMVDLSRKKRGIYSAKIFNNQFAESKTFIIK